MATKAEIKAKLAVASVRKLSAALAVASVRKLSAAVKRDEDRKMVQDAIREGVRFLHPSMHLSRANGGGVHSTRCTVAYQRTEEGLYEIGVSFCSAKDTFSRERGRTEALFRLCELPFAVTVPKVANGARPADAFMRVLEVAHLVGVPGAPVLTMARASNVSVNNVIWDW